MACLRTVLRSIAMIAFGSGLLVGVFAVLVFVADVGARAFFGDFDPNIVGPIIFLTEIIVAVGIAHGVAECSA